MSPVAVLFCSASGKEKKHAHTSTRARSVGVFAPTSTNLSKHAGFQTIQSHTKETRLTGPRLCFLSSGWVIWKEREVLWAIYIHRVLSHFRVDCGLQAWLQSGRTITSLFDRPRSHAFHYFSAVMSKYRVQCLMSEEKREQLQSITITCCVQA